MFESISLSGVGELGTIATPHRAVSRQEQDIQNLSSGASAPNHRLESSGLCWYGCRKSPRIVNELGVVQKWRQHLEAAGPRPLYFSANRPKWSLHYARSPAYRYDVSFFPPPPLSPLADVIFGWPLTGCIPAINAVIFRACVYGF